MGFLKDWRISQKSGDSDRLLMSQRAITGLVDSKALPDGGEAGQVLKIGEDGKPEWGAGGGKSLYQVNCSLSVSQSGDYLNVSFSFVSDTRITTKEEFIQYVTHLSSISCSGMLLYAGATYIAFIATRATGANLSVKTVSITDSLGKSYSVRLTDSSVTMNYFSNVPI